MSESSCLRGFDDRGFQQSSQGITSWMPSVLLSVFGEHQQEVLWGQVDVRTILPCLDAKETLLWNKKCSGHSSATMTALEKRGCGVRGIATGTVFRRLVSKTLARQSALSTRAGVECCDM